MGIRDPLKRQQNLLKERYDLADKPAGSVTMSKGKPVQGGVRVKLPRGMTWDGLAGMTPAEIKAGGHWPAGHFPPPHPKHEAGGVFFTRFLIDETKKRTGRDLTRFDADFDLPDHCLPESPPSIHLTTRPDLGVVSEGTLDDTVEFFNVVLGLKLTTEEKADLVAFMQAL